MRALSFLVACCGVNRNANASSPLVSACYFWYQCNKGLSPGSMSWGSVCVLCSVCQAAECCWEMMESLMGNSSLWSWESVEKASDPLWAALALLLRRTSESLAYSPTEEKALPLLPSNDTGDLLWSWIAQVSSTTPGFSRGSSKGYLSFGVYFLCAVTGRLLPTRGGVIRDAACPHHHASCHTKAQPFSLDSIPAA